MTSQVQIEQPKPLSANEGARLLQLEKTIQDDMAAFIRVGQALTEIRGRRLYRITHPTFEAYIKTVFDIAKRTAYQYIDAADIMEKVRNCALSWEPTNEAQCRPLAKIAKSQPEKLRVVIKMALETAKDGHPTSSHIKKAVTSFMGDTVRRGVRQARTKPAAATSPLFQAAYDALITQIDTEHAAGWRHTDKKVVVESLRLLLAAIEGNPATGDLEATA